MTTQNKDPYVAFLESELKKKSSIPKKKKVKAKKKRKNRKKVVSKSKQKKTNFSTTGNEVMLYFILCAVVSILWAYITN